MSLEPRAKRSIGFCHGLRVAAAFVVVAAHVTGGSADSLPSLSLSWWICILLYMGCYWSVPVFVMISGLLLLNPTRQESPGQFYRRRLHRISTPLIVWTLLYLVLRFQDSTETFSAMPLFNLIASGRPYTHLWYFYMIIGLYLMTPFLRTFVQVTPQAQRIGLIIAGLVLADAYHLTNMMFWGNSSSIFTLFIPFMSYYLLGYELSLGPVRFRAKYVWLALAACLAYVGTLFPAFLELKGQQYGLFFFSFFCPPVSLTCITLFVLVQRWYDRLPGWWQRAMVKLSPTTLGIYVIHIAVLLGLQQLGSQSQQPDAKDLAVTLIAGPIVAFALSAGITAILLKIPYVRRTVG